MNPLTELLRSEMARRGPIPFREFMATALYHPEHGYYASGRARIGRGGDFFTNVSIGPLFGRLLARQFAEMWERLGRPTRWTIVEQGAHDGQFARDALDGLREFAPDCFAVTEYWIVEPNETRWELQGQRLEGLPVKWVPALDNLPTFTGVHFSNELLDAFPIHLAESTPDGWRERYVVCDQEHFVFSLGPLSSARLETRLAAITAPPGFVTEINLAADDWIDTLHPKLERGYVLAIDYGYTREEFFERHAGTLSAYTAHQRESDPLARPGEIDLTAHVEFTSLIEHAQRTGFRTLGFTDQHRFMIGVSRLHFREDTIPSSAELRAFKTLMHPAFMGQAFKVLGLAKGTDAGALSGFSPGKKPSGPTR